MNTKDLIQKELPQLLQDKVYYGELMKKHTSFKVGGPAEAFIKVENDDEVEQIQEFAKKKSIPLTVLGNGTNVLVTDKGIKGIVLKMNIKKIIIKEIDSQKFIVTVGAGNTLTEVAYSLQKKGITGFEELAGIPGTVGGAIKMNAGAHGKEIKDVIKQAKVIDEKGQIKVLQKDQMELSYRNSIFSKEKAIIIEADFILESGNKEEIKDKMEEYAKIRKERQPLEYPSAGSTFKRGDDFITAKLIDESNLKGVQIGGAQISEKHAGFIINKNNATAKDIQDLIKYTQDKVYEKFNVKIQLEVEVLGE